MMLEMKYSELIKANHMLEDKKSPEYKITVLSNIMVHQSKDVFEYVFRTEGINVNVYLGDYDNITQGSSKCADSNAVFVFWELCNLIDGLQYKIDLLDNHEYQSLIDRVKVELDLTLNNLDNTPLILFNKFSAAVFDQYSVGSSRLNELANILNEYLSAQRNANLMLVDIEKVLAQQSVSNSIDLRYYYSAKTLYNIAFYKGYCEHIKPIIMSVNGKAKKALIFDCDNTLWQGILDEDGYDGIKMNSEVQYLAKALARKGVIIGLCSKNNPQDVDEVFAKHEDAVLGDDDIVIKKVNWTDKVTNLKAIAGDLNIALDSLVFVDDSNFEVNLVRKQLPMVEVFQVPAKLHEYPMMLRRICNLFYNTSQTAEDVTKVEMYKVDAKRAAEEAQIGDIEEYLKTLGLKITIYVDDVNQTKRMSQMTQKTNQFNLTTKRYTEKQIEHLIDSPNTMLVAIGVSDRFGDSGVVGLVIVTLSPGREAQIDSLLMSCRVLGRNIEYKLMDIIVDLLKGRAVERISGEYIKTNKNQQVADLFDRYGLRVLERSDTHASYQLDVKDYKYTDTEYIECHNAR